MPFIIRSDCIAEGISFLTKIAGSCDFEWRFSENLRPLLRLLSLDGDHQPGGRSALAAYNAQAVCIRDAVVIVRGRPRCLSDFADGSCIFLIIAE
ncbi:hypothetical protein AOQ73_26665 [Bradyrhizobium pachyrhizi]|nr:hypothetical protein AOQ73_26665 [Bradyrhizobium pachyrhizi]